MQGIGEAIKYLYQQFILRDVVAYVTPGAILIATGLKVLLGTVTAIAFIKAIPVAVYLPLYGALFITGLALENLGEVLLVLRFHNRHDDDEHFRILQAFHFKTSAADAGKDAGQDDAYGSALERTRERITVKKYASGNIAVALIVSMMLLLFTRLRPNLSVWALGVVGVVLIASLIRAHWFQLKLQKIWEDEGLKTPGTSSGKHGGQRA